MAGPTTSGLAALIQGEDWHYVGATDEPAFENGWTNLVSTPAIAFRIRQEGIVDLVGIGSGGNAETIYTLPEGYRPTSMAMPAILAQDGTDYIGAVLFVEADGKVTPYVPGLSTGDPITVIISTIAFLNSPDLA